MKTLKRLILNGIFSLMIMGCSNGQPADIKVDTSKTETYYFAVEINDVLCGYAETKVSPMMKNEEPMLLFEGDVHVLLSLLGEGMDLDIDYFYHISTDQTSFNYSEADTKVGNTKIHASNRIDGNTAHFESTMGGKPKTVELPDGVILETPLVYPHIKADFIGTDITEKNYLVYDDTKGEIAEKEYKRIGEEDLELSGSIYHTIVFEELNLNTGLKIKLWLRPDDGMVLKSSYIGGRVIYLSDRSIRKKITAANMNEILFTSANVKINDVQNISYMKVDAKIESVGEWLTAENLNYPGQKFTGTVTENLIEGIFEIEHTRWDGKNAPLFPYDYSNDTSLTKYLEPEDLIESDDPVLIEKAKEIANGSEDSWDAAKRLSKWVAEEIKGAVPGGTTARRTYDTRSGECGSHSRLLAAFCRGVGIPARMVVGCMYSNLYNGTFGQHAWNEIYMGEAGWIPIDATAFELDYIDCGHIKLGEKTTFHPEKMEILEYRVGNEEPVIEESVVPDNYSKYIGKYTNPKTGNVLNVGFEDGNLGVDIPGKMLITLYDPDENGSWYAKISNNLYFTFLENDANEVTNMHLIQIIPFQKKPDTSLNINDIPEKFKPYIGIYHSFALHADFEVLYKDNSLAVDDPMAGMVIGLQPPDDKGMWLDEFNQNLIAFEYNDEGDVTYMNAYTKVDLLRGEMAMPIVEKEIEDAGIDAGINRYYDMKKAAQGTYVFTEWSMNDLGYKLLEKEDAEAAIEVFKLNVEAYPESFNVYDSLGEAYMKHGEKELAIENYQKSLELNPDNTNAVEILEEIKE